MNKIHIFEDANADCWWCGRNEWIDFIIVDGDTFYWCHRHEVEVKDDINYDPKYD